MIVLLKCLPDTRRLRRVWGWGQERDKDKDKEMKADIEIHPQNNNRMTEKIKYHRREQFVTMI